MLKSVTNTLISFRISYKTKQKLLEVLEEELRKNNNFPNAGITDLIKIAIEKTWGVNCYDDAES